MKKVSSKFLVLIATFCLVVVGATVSLVAVLAARNTGLQTGYTITYTASGIKATVSGRYLTGNSSSLRSTYSSTALKLSGSNSTSMVFSGNETGTGASGAYTQSFETISASTLSISGDTDTVIFEYTIVNNDTSRAVSISLEQNPYSAKSNMLISYSVVNDGVTTGAQTYDDLVTQLGAGKTAVISVILTVDDLDYDASFTGQSFNFLIQKASLS